MQKIKWEVEKREIMWEDKKVDTQNIQIWSEKM